MTSRRVLKLEAIKLRKQGKSYKDISLALGCVPKSTLSNWLSDITVPYSYEEYRRLKNLAHLHEIRQLAYQKNSLKRSRYLASLFSNNRQLFMALDDVSVSKVALTMLYIAEGGKTGGNVTFANSDCRIIKLFISLLRKCYFIDDSKFRVTIQCREDQDIDHLRNFWNNITNIPFSQFYKTRIDPRSIGKKTLKADYKGVCRLNYFSAHIHNDLIQAFNVLLGP